MDIRKSDTAVVFIDPQNDVLSEGLAPLAEQINGDQQESTGQCTNDRQAVKDNASGGQHDGAHSLGAVPPLPIRFHVMH